ncbi:MAG TPA: electron transport complex subunit RsxC [Ignavibacteriaceae bacterium]|nr:electron transport complex subunit RsxC [Ignavibacteriaceae bacterium]
MLLKTFRGGVHPPEEKTLTDELGFEMMPPPKQVIIPLSQHLGKQAKPIVKKGSPVSAGTLIAEADGFISAPVYSSVTGIVASLGRESNAGGFPKDAIVINTNEHQDKITFEPLNPDTVSPEEIRDRVKLAGIVGQGGAAFPTYVKLTPPKDQKIELIILNGCECEPYLTRDYRFMLERPEALLGGLKLIMKSLGVEKGWIGIEDNKPEAVKILKKLVENETGISIVTLKTKYPQGAEKMLIKAVTKKEVPPGKLPLDVGIVIQNIGTAVAVYDAVVKGEPLLTAAVTVSGRGIKNPKNLIVPVGTTIKDILDYCGGVTEDAVKIIVGGPMMGVAQYDLSAPVMKATSGIIVLTKEDVEEQEETACLKCGKCIGACPINLMPTKLVRYIQIGNYEAAENLGVTVCMECGTCAFTCPANIPLVQWLRFGKQKAFQIQKERSLQKV